MNQRPIPISDLAAYAVDPEGFVARRGRPANEAAAQYGSAVHESFAREPPSGGGRALGLVIAALILLLVVLVARTLR